MPVQSGIWRLFPLRQCVDTVQQFSLVLSDFLFWFCLGVSILLSLLFILIGEIMCGLKSGLLKLVCDKWVSKLYLKKYFWVLIFLCNLFSEQFCYTGTEILNRPTLATVRWSRDSLWYDFKQSGKRRAVLHGKESALSITATLNLL